MKKKIILGLSIFSLVILLGGLYVILTIQNTTSTLDSLIMLHQVEILREHLLIDVKRVQADLTLKNTRHARGIDTVVRDVEKMCDIAKTCLDCHHSEAATHRLMNLREHVEGYSGLLSRALTIRANTARLEEEEENAFRAGENIIREVNEMVTQASLKLEDRTTAAMKVIANTKYILFGLIALAPAVAMGLGFIFIRAFTKPLNTVLNATRRLRAGDLDFRVEPLKDECGEVAESFNEMAVALKEYVSKIEESEKRYRMLFESAADAIFILEAEGERPGKIVAANQAAARMHGYTVNELVTLSITDLDSPDAARQAPGLIRRMLEGERIHTEMTHVRKDGTIFPVEVSAGLFEAGGRKFILAIDRDVTERKRAEDALQRAVQMKMVGELAAGLAHEIKNPLAGIKTSMEVLSVEAPLPDEDKDILEKVIVEINRIEALIKSLLNFARPPTPQFSQVNVNAVIDAALDLSLRNRANPTGPDLLGIVKDFDANIPVTTADPMQLKQVFLNLFLNASDAMPCGGTLNVKTLYDSKTDCIQIDVADTGTGIAQGEIDRIFMPFFSTKTKGTGLGLAITKRLIEGHGGSITAKSAPGQGTLFRITLPVKHGAPETT
ncbi:MAG: PAS domain S-box protein [Chloroflexota bacterium]